MQHRTSVARNWLCLDCLREGTATVCADKGKHLREVHADGLAELRDMLPVYDSGKVDRRRCEPLRQIRRTAITEVLGKLPPDDAERLGNLLELVDRFLPEECGGADRSLDPSEPSS